MKIKEYAAVILFASLTITAAVVGIATNNKDVLLSCYSFVIMTLIAYVIKYINDLRKELYALKELFKK